MYDAKVRGETKRTFLATGEALLRAHREDPRFDFSATAMEYAKAVETELNALVFPALRRELGRKAPAQRETRVDGRPLDLGRPLPHQTLGVIQNLLEHEPIVTQGLTPAFPQDWRWLVGLLPAQLETLAALRNPAAHSKVLRRDPAVELRNSVLGVGAEGLVVQIARARMRRAR